MGEKTTDIMSVVGYWRNSVVRHSDLSMHHALAISSWWGKDNKYHVSCGVLKESERGSQVFFDHRVLLWPQPPFWRSHMKDACCCTSRSSWHKQRSLTLSWCICYMMTETHPKCKSTWVKQSTWKEIDSLLSPETTANPQVPYSFQ